MTDQTKAPRILISDFDRKRWEQVYYVASDCRFGSHLAVDQDTAVEARPGDLLLVNIGLDKSWYPEELALLQERGLSFAGKGPGNTYMIKAL